MTRVHDRHTSAGPSAANRHRRADQKRKTSYKVILEEVADKQKKLKTVLYPEQKAPRGYTFIPAGDPQLTNRCKKLAREDGLTVFIVSTSRHPRQGLSREIHRVGFHFPSITVEKACDSLGVTLLNSGRVLQSNFAHLEDGQDHDSRRPTKQKKQKAGTRNAQPVLDISLPQAVIDTSARETIRDLFPNIPDQDLHVIVGRSFQKGKGLVGTVADLSLVRRAQLAVIAHIRHTYTEYDSLLRQVQYNEARRRVEKPCLDRLIRWRGDDDDAEDMDDVLREVIVIPDDDEADDEGDETQESLRMRPEENERDSSVEYISEADMQVQPVDYSNINRTVERGDSYSPESDKEIQYLGRNQLRHGRQVQFDQHALDRMGTHRQRIYEEALNRRRKHPENLNVHNEQSSRSVFASSGHNGFHPMSQQPQDRNRLAHLAEGQDFGRAPVQRRTMLVARPDGYRADPYSNARDPAYVPEEQVAYSSQQDPRVHERSLEQPKTIYYAKEDQPYNNGTRSLGLRQVSNRSFDQGVRFVSQNGPGQENGINLYVHDFEAQSRQRSEMVLPSIERDLPDGKSDQLTLHEETRQVNPFGSYQPLNRGAQHLPVHSIVNLNDYEEQPSSKRRRIDDQQPIDSYSQGRTILVPIEQIDDRPQRYEKPREAAYRDGNGHFVSDKRIVPLPPKEERARPPTSNQELQLFSPRDHYQLPLSRSENVEYYNDSPSFFDSSQFIPRHHESSGLGFSSRHDVGVIAESDRVYAGSNEAMRRFQPWEANERSMPSRFSNMSIDHSWRDEDRRPDRITYVPSIAMADFRRHTRPPTGALSYFFATATVNVHGHIDHAIPTLTYALDTAKDGFHEEMEPPTHVRPHDINERQPAATNFDYPPSRMQQLPGVQQQPVWPVKENALSYGQPNQQHIEPDRAEPFQRRAPPSASRAAMEPWDTNIQSRKGPLNGPAEGRRIHPDLVAARLENVRPVRREYDDFRAGQRKGPDDIVVLD